MTDHDVADDNVIAQGTAAAPPPAAKAGLASRVRALIGQHKLGSAIAVLLVAAAVAGVASGSLKGKPASSTSTEPGTSTEQGAGTVAYSKPATAPAFTLPSLNYASTGGPGTAGTVSLAQYQGKPLIVNFFASWCTPCQQETPLIARFYKANGGHVGIIGVDGFDSNANAIAFVRAKGVSYPVGVDPNNLIAVSTYNVAAFPQTFFLDSRHRIVFRVIGPVTQAELRQGDRLMDTR